MEAKMQTNVPTDPHPQFKRWIGGMVAELTKRPKGGWLITLKGDWEKDNELGEALAGWHIAE